MISHKKDFAYSIMSQAYDYSLTKNYNKISRKSDIDIYIAFILHKIHRGEL